MQGIGIVLMGVFGLLLLFWGVTVLMGECYYAPKFFVGKHSSKDEIRLFGKVAIAVSVLPFAITVILYLNLPLIMGLLWMIGIAAGIFCVCVFLAYQ